VVIGLVLLDVAGVEPLLVAVRVEPAQQAEHLHRRTADVHPGDHPHYPKAVVRHAVLHNVGQHSVRLNPVFRV